MKNFWTQIVRKCSPKNLETINTHSFQKYFQLLKKCYFCTMNVQKKIRMKIRFEKYLAICDIYVNSKYFCNQIISKERNSGEFLWNRIS